VYQDGSWGIPAIYLHDWPDRYIHTTWDTPDKIDPTKLRRAAFIGAASGYFLATPAERTKDWFQWPLPGSHRRGIISNRQYSIDNSDKLAFDRYSADYQAAELGSVSDFDVPRGGKPLIDRPWEQTMRAQVTGDSALLFERVPSVKGPMSVFGYSYLDDKLGPEGVGKLRLLQYQGIRGAGSDYAYEVLNLVNGKLLVAHIRNIVSAIYGPIPMELVLEYLQGLEQAGVVKQAH
jgi:hypothetical protein